MKTCTHPNIVPFYGVVRLPAEEHRMRGIMRVSLSFVADAVAHLSSLTRALPSPLTR